MEINIKIKWNPKGWWEYHVDVFDKKKWNGGYQTEIDALEDASEAVVDILDYHT